MYEAKRGVGGELVFLENGKNKFRMIPVSINENGIVCREANSPCYIIIQKGYDDIDKKLKNGCNYYEACYKYSKDEFRKYTEEVFDYIAYNAEHSNTQDYGIDDEFTYAYIMAHTEPENHRYLRFYDWSNGDISNGFVSLKDNWKMVLKLPEKSMGKKPEYYRIPTCIGNLRSKNKEWHIFPVIYKIEKNGKQTIMYHDNLNSDRKNTFPKSIQNNVKELGVGKPYCLNRNDGASTACAFATVEFFKQSDEEIEQFSKKTLKELQEKKLPELQENLKNIQNKAKNQKNWPIQTINDVKTKQNQSEGCNLNLDKEKTNSEEQKKSDWRKIFEKCSINNLTPRQQKAELSYIERYKKAREQREKERENRIDFYKMY